MPAISRDNVYPLDISGMQYHVIKGSWIKVNVFCVSQSTHAHHQRLCQADVGAFSIAFAAFSTLGVVFGDIGTSPIYVYSSIFPDGAPNDEKLLLGTFSMIFWTLTIVVLLKYVVITLMADDHGEGGVIALYYLIKRAAGLCPADDLAFVDQSAHNAWTSHKMNTYSVTEAVRNALHRKHVNRFLLLLFVVLTTNMIIADGVLTPAISVVSAVEGIQFNTGISLDAVVGISVGILLALFLVQPLGTQKLSFCFSPIIFVWFLSNLCIGVYNLVKYQPSAAKGLSPYYIYYYWSGDPTSAWKMLSKIFLSITGAEALYADLGHFDARSIRIAFISIVYPSLTLTYLGQTAFILKNNQAASTAFWSSAPGPFYTLMVILATLATIIASQALITAAFSIIKQAISLGFYPQMAICNTSAKKKGQIFIPFVNYVLMVGCIFVVAIFKTSDRISNAYGKCTVLEAS